MHFSSQFYSLLLSGLAPGFVLAQEPASSKGGILFEKKDAICWMDPATSEYRRIVELPRVGMDGLDWAPDLSKFAFGSNRNGRWCLYWADLEGTVTRIPKTYSDFILGVKWSPDGQSLAYHFDGKGIGTGGVYVVDWQGKASRRLSPERGFDRYFSWAPDSQQIALTASKRSEVKTSHDVIWVERQTELQIMDAHGGDRIEVTDLGTEILEMAWSPDGKHIAFKAEDRLYVIGVAQQMDGPHLLMEGLARHGAPAWSPDSKRIAVIQQVETGRKSKWGQEEFDYNLAIVNLEGKFVSFPGGGGDIWHYAWGPQGKRIAWTEPVQLVQLDLASKQTQVLVEEIDYWSEIAWK